MAMYTRFFVPAAVLWAGSFLLAQQPPRAVPVVAELEGAQTTFLADGNQIQKPLKARFVRDADGRTRLEDGRFATIFDPVEKVTIVLDLEQKTARRMLHAPQASRSVSGQGPAQQKPHADLGTQTIAGVTATGKQFVDVIPAGSPLGNKQPIQKVTEVWFADSVQLPMQVTIKDPVAGTTTTQYRIIQHGQKISPEVFRIPSGFQLIEGGLEASKHIGTAQFERKQ
jgi:outer membrane lipoprotein-sorting protein